MYMTPCSGLRFAHEGDMAKIKLWIDGNRHRRFFNAMLNATDGCVPSRGGGGWSWGSKGV